MDVNLLRAVLWSLWQRRKHGKRALLWVLGVSLAPGLALSAFLGWSFAQALPGLDARLLGSALAQGLLALSLLAAIWDGTPALDPVPLRPFQAKPGALFAAELMCSLLAPLRLAQAALLVAFALGAGLARFRLLPLLLAFAPMLLIAQLCMERLAGRLTRLAGRHLRTGLVFAALLLPMRYVVNEMGRLLLGAPVLAAAGQMRLTEWPAWLPTGTALSAWQAAANGQPLSNGGLLAGSLLWPGLWTLALIGLTGLALRRELNEDGQTGKTPARRLWRFDCPWAGVARHRWHSLWNSRQGRLFVFAPLLAPLIQADAMLVRLRPGTTFVIGSVGWVMLPLGSLACAIFGLDRGAVRAMWTWPLEDSDLLLGKVLGTAAYQGVVIALFLAVLPVATPMPARLLPAVLLFCAALACFQLRAGLRLSIEQPRPLDPAGLNPGELDDAHFIRIGNLLLPWLLLVLTWLAGACLGERTLLLLMVGATCLGILLLHRALPRAARLLMHQRDHLSAGLEGR